MSTAVKELTSAIKAFALSRVLMTAIELEVFPFLDASKKEYTPEELASCLALRWEFAKPFFQTLVASGHLRYREDKILLDEKAKEILEHHHNLKSWVPEMCLTYASLADLPAMMRTGQYQKTALSKYWGYKQDSVSRDPGTEGTADYSMVMDVSQEAMSQSLGEAFDFSAVRSLVDFGGGYGRLGMTLARMHQHLQVTVLDLPSVASKARQFIEEQGLASHVRALGVDFLKDPLSLRTDVVSFSRVLHDWDDSSVRTLLQRAHQVLNPGGTLLICEPLQVEDSFSLDADAAAYSFMCALIGGKRRSFCEFQTMLGEAGFGSISRKPLGVYSNTVIQAKA